ncbi:MAG: SRPBCC family protein [Planctomycetota bacterium]
MKILKILLILLVLFVALLVGAALMLDKDYSVESSITINAKPEAIHAYVGDLKKWDEWTPFEEADPGVKVTLGAKTVGVGASQTWTSDQGSGSLTFTKSDPKTGLAYDMAITSPGSDDPQPAKCEMIYSPDGDGTKVTWTMKGEMKGFLGGIMAAVVPGLVTTIYDKGLQNLKAKAETKAN